MTAPAPGIAGRYGMRVRTPELPMAFTFDEFAGGAWRAWWTFSWVFPIAFSLANLAGSLLTTEPQWVANAINGSLYVLLFGYIWEIPWTLAGLALVGGPCAWLLGLALRRVRSLRVHLAAFGLLGLVVGALMASLAGTIMGLGPISAVPSGALVAGVAVPYGWYRAAKRALGDDARFGEPTAPQRVPSREFAESQEYSADTP